MKNRIKLLVMVAAVSLVLTVPIFWFCEHSANSNVGSIFDAVWWWVVTSGTVGYGDIVPATFAGRIIGIITIFVGFFIFANLIAVIAESVHTYLERKELGTAQVDIKDHIVICEYTAIADELIQSLPKCPLLADKQVVIVSNLVPRNPYPQHNFVNGVPINPDTLKKANIRCAKYVFIFVNHRFADPDVKTLHIASRVKALNPDAITFVEMIDPQNELLNYAPKNLVVMDSRELLKSVLRDNKIDPIAMMQSVA